MYLTHVGKWPSAQLDTVVFLLLHSPPPLLIIGRSNLAITSLLLPIAPINNTDCWGNTLQEVNIGMHKGCEKNS